MKAFTIFALLFILSCTMSQEHTGRETTPVEHMGGRESTSNLIKNKEHTVNISFDKLEAGKVSPVNITIADERGPIKNLEIDHEKKLHAFFVRKDLEEFLHLHGEDGETFELKPEFPSGGEWFAAIEWKHKGQLYYENKELLVEGAKKEIAKDYTKKKNKNGYTMKLLTDEIKSGEVLLEFSVGNITLQNYLGAPAHIAIWSEDRTFFTHAHAEANGKLLARTNLPKSGDYKIWIQFKHNDTVQTFGYWVTV